jgi:hypothetical protein
MYLFTRRDSFATSACRVYFGRGARLRRGIMMRWPLDVAWRAGDDMAKRLAAGRCGLADRRAGVDSGRRHQWRWTPSISSEVLMCLNAVVHVCGCGICTVDVVRRVIPSRPWHALKNGLAMMTFPAARLQKSIGAPLPIEISCRLTPRVSSSTRRP